MTHDTVAPRRFVRRSATLIALAFVWAAPGSAAASSPDDPPDLSGTWAKKVVMTSVSDPPVVGEVTSRTVTYLRYEISQAGPNLQIDSETCDVSIRSDSSTVDTILPDAFVRALPNRARSAKLLDAGGSPVLVFDRRYAILGSRLREPTEERLPDSPDDSRVVDADDDGHPGVTVRIDGMVEGEIYVAQRAWDEYRARVHDTRRIVGRVHWKNEQVVLDANSAFLQTQPPTEARPDHPDSYFEMVRISSQLDCSEIPERAGELFEGPRTRRSSRSRE